MAVDKFLKLTLLNLLRECSQETEIEDDEDELMLNMLHAVTGIEKDHSAADSKPTKATVIPKKKMTQLKKPLSENHRKKSQKRKRTNSPSVDRDNITSFPDLKENVNANIKLDIWSVCIEKYSVAVFQMKEINGIAQISKKILVKDDLSISAYVGESANLISKDLKLSRWSQLKNIISFVKRFENNQTSNPKTKSKKGGVSDPLQISPADIQSIVENTI